MLMVEFTVPTSEREQMLDITSLVREAVIESGVSDGVAFCHVPHTTAAITINENADPSVRADIEHMLEKLVPWDAEYRHAEGNSAAHIKASLMGASVQIPVENGRLLLGTWQGVYFCEFDGPRNRRCRVVVMGD